MGRKDEARWFKNYATDEAIISNAKPVQVGAAFQAALQYFVFGEPLEETEALLNDPVTRLLYSMFKRRADESIEDYNKRVENGRKNAANRNRKTAQEDAEPEEVTRQQDNVFDDWLEQLENLPP
jgi:hypothetical protein